jgi:hypothetical protein
MARNDNTLDTGDLPGYRRTTSRVRGMDNTPTLEVRNLRFAVESGRACRPTWHGGSSLGDQPSSYNLSIFFPAGERFHFIRPA